MAIERIGTTTVQGSGTIDTTIDIPASATYIVVLGVSYGGGVTSIAIDSSTCDLIGSGTANAMNVYAYGLDNPTTGNGIDFDVTASSGFSEGVTWHIIFLATSGEVTVRGYDIDGSNSAFSLSTAVQTGDYCLIHHGANGGVQVLTWDEGFTGFLDNISYRNVTARTHDLDVTTTETLESTSSAGASYAAAMLISLYTSGGGGTANPWYHYAQQ